jgi:hypothetical protein
MKALLFSALLLMTFTAYAQQSHILKIQSLSGNIIRISFKERYASIEVKDEALVQDAFSELKEFMKHLSGTHFLSRIYPLYVISPENKYFTYPLNRQKLNKRVSRNQKLIASVN